MRDKTEWGDGPWQTEPDEYRWVDATTNYRCHILRPNDLGTLCGYVAVPSYNLLHEIGYAKDFRTHGPPELFIEVHGGLTYSNEYDGLWTFGFDAGHVFDYRPAKVGRVSAMYNEVGPEEYRTIDYMKAETTKLAQQLYQFDTDERYILWKLGQ